MPGLRIPALAMLTLSLTDCVERSPGADVDRDPIIGDWHAVMVDGQAAPVVMNRDGYTVEAGLELHVKSDLQGSLLYTVDYDYDGYLGSYAEGSSVVVDAGAAPRYRVDVKHDFLGVSVEGGERPPEPYDTDSYATDGPGDPGYDTDPTGGGTDGALGGPGSSRPLRIPLDIRHAPAEMVLRCTLDAETLNCQRDGDEMPKILVFERDAE